MATTNMPLPTATRVALASRIAAGEGEALRASTGLCLATLYRAAGCAPVTPLVRRSIERALAPSVATDQPTAPAVGE